MKWVLFACVTTVVMGLDKTNKLRKKITIYLCLRINVSG